MNRQHNGRTMNAKHLWKNFLCAALAAVMGFSVPGAAQAQTGTVTFYHNDALGSPVAATDAGGDVIWRKTYDPYGREFINGGSAAASNNIGYTGHLFDNDLGLVYAGARYYDPELGRFMSVDPVGFRQGAVQSFNKYAYANNNPYRYKDPDGNIPVETLWDLANVGMGVVSLGTNLIAGNFAGAAWDLGGIILDTAAVFTPYVPGGAGSALKTKRAAEAIQDATVYRRGTFADEAADWEGNYVKGKKWATENPLDTEDFAQRYGLPAENSGKPDWVVKGKVEGEYSTGAAPPSHNAIENTGGATEVIPEDPNAVRLQWFHMTD